MNTTLGIEFSVDKENRRIYIERQFAAPLSKVWTAWTDSKLLDQWWAPKPWKARTRNMDFRVGGSWLYAMVGPDGEEHYAINKYKSIVPGKGFSGLDAFSDAEGNINKDLPQNIWEVNFVEQAGTTSVKINLSFDQTEDLEKIIEMGFKEGFKSALENLDELLKQSR